MTHNIHKTLKRAKITPTLQPSCGQPKIQMWLPWRPEIMIMYACGEAALTITHCSCLYLIQAQGIISVLQTPD